VDLISALLAVGTAYLTYFNYLIFKRSQAGTKARPLVLLGYRSLVAMILFVVATGLFVVSAVTSSEPILAIAAFAMAAGAILRQMLRIIR
jgi:hypothetical protein